MGQAYASDTLGMSAASYSVGGKMSDGTAGGGAGVGGTSSSGELYYSCGLKPPRHSRDAWKRRVGGRGMGRAGQGGGRGGAGGYISSSSTGMDIPGDWVNGR